jgi:hypothetical protein
LDDWASASLGPTTQQGGLPEMRLAAPITIPRLRKAMPQHEFENIINKYMPINDYIITFLTL